MAASDHLSPSQFFHGSPFEHEPGKVLTPQEAAKHPGFANYDVRHGNTPHVYFTSSQAHASGYSRTQQRLNPGGQHHTYEVEPLGDVERDPYDHSGTSYRDPVGVRVVRKLGISGQA